MYMYIYFVGHTLLSQLFNSAVVLENQIDNL